VPPIAGKTAWKENIMARDKASFHPSMNAAQWAMLVALSILWSGSFFFVGLVTKELPSFTIVAVRVGLASLVLLAAAHAMGLRIPQGRKVWLAFFGAGALNNTVPFCLIAWGQTHIASGLASILNAATPLATLIIAHLFTADEKMTARHLIGVLIGFAGVVIIVGPSTLHGAGNNVTAQLACLGAALSYACGAVFSRCFKRLKLPTIVGAAGQVTASAVLLIPAALIIDRPWSLPAPGLPTWSALVSMAVFSTAIATILYFRILAAAGAMNLLLVTFLVPVSAIALGALLLGEQLMPEHFCGLACIGFSLAVIDGRLLHIGQRSRSTV
jgi:drug/metabolite transporter (DMT)-like permease